MEDSFLNLLIEDFYKLLSLQCLDINNKGKYKIIKPVLKELDNLLKTNNKDSRHYLELWANYAAKNDINYEEYIVQVYEYIFEKYVQLTQIDGRKSISDLIREEDEKHEKTRHP